MHMFCQSSVPANTWTFFLQYVFILHICGELYQIQISIFELDNGTYHQLRQVGSRWGTCLKRQSAGCRLVVGESATNSGAGGGTWEEYQRVGREEILKSGTWGIITDDQSTAASFSLQVLLFLMGGLLLLPPGIHSLWLLLMMSSLLNLRAAYATVPSRWGRIASTRACGIQLM